MSSVGVDCSRHPNWIWLPLFYQLPKELLEGKSEYLSLPRCPYDVLHPEFASMITKEKREKDKKSKEIRE